MEFPRVAWFVPRFRCPGGKAFPHPIKCTKTTENRKSHQWKRAVGERWVVEFKITLKPTRDRRPIAVAPRQSFIRVFFLGFETSRLCFVQSFATATTVLEKVVVSWLIFYNLFFAASKFYDARHPTPRYHAIGSFIDRAVKVVISFIEAFNCIIKMTFEKVSANCSQRWN